MATDNASAPLGAYIVLLTCSFLIAVIAGLAAYSDQIAAGRFAIALLCTFEVGWVLSYR